MGARVAFDLPDWFPPQRLDFSQRYVGLNGEVNWDATTRIQNSAENALFKLKGADEFNSGACFGPHVVFRYPAGCNLPDRIKDTQAKLQRLMGRYKESRE